MAASELQAAEKKTHQALKKWLAESGRLREAPPPEAKQAEPSLDPWQKEAFDALREGRSVVVDAPTTAGKTRVVEAFFRENVSDPRFRAAYTTPVKSLSNDKVREFREMFGAENVGIATGDIKENLDAPIVVATLESYRNSLLGVEPDLGRRLVVFDEYHFLQDIARGSAWEEAIILTPPTCQLLLLSASVSNGEEFCEWLNALGQGRDAVLVRTETRPVPLTYLVYCVDRWLLAETVPGRLWKNLDKKRMEIPPRQEEIGERLAELGDLDLTPCIVYAGRRLACETMATILTRHLAPLSGENRQAIRDSLGEAQEEFRGREFLTPPLKRMIEVHGVAFHHSGLAPLARMAIEKLVKEGRLRFCVATMGLSLGINFSVRSAMITDYDRPGEGGFTAYSPSEVLQMLGRAGRRGRDTVGFCLWPTPESMAKLGDAQREPCKSRLRNDPTTFLGLVGRGFSLRAIEHFYAKSFQQFQNKQLDLRLVTRDAVTKALGAEDVPCESAIAEYSRYLLDEPESLCGECRYRSRCHQVLDGRTARGLAALHVHLHQIGALNRQEKLTSFGSIARYFPQAGGFVVAHKITTGEINSETLVEACELAAALCLARFKEPGKASRYRFPFPPREVEEDLEWFYPYDLFPELWDEPFRKRPYPVIREFQPDAGYMIRAWLDGTDWKSLSERVSNERFGSGDMMSLLYRVGTYLQSMTQTGIPDIARPARALRETLLREPLSYGLTL